MPLLNMYSFTAVVKVAVQRVFVRAYKLHMYEETVWVYMYITQLHMYAELKVLGIHTK